MNKTFTLLLLLAITANLFAEIGVKSFRKLENDLDARVNEPLKDQNGDICAIVKVVTTQTGFSFDCGQIGIVKTSQKPSEIWVYLPYGAKRITISHPQLGMLRDYLFMQPIEKATVYELVLTTGKVITTVDESIESQWLLITTEPPKALVYINDQFVTTGEYQSKLKSGIYTYRVEAPLYHTEAGKIEIADAKKELKVSLKPSFGFIRITTSPESAATVLIDGKETSKTTPYTSEAISSGAHIVQVIKEMYQPVTQKIVVTDEQTVNVNFNLSPSFAELNITSPNDAAIYVNNQQKGIGQWQGHLNSGVYSLEARKEKYRSAKQDVELVAGDKLTIDLQPIAIYGSLDIITTPSGATITIDGQEHGTTPNTINKLLIGNHTVSLNKIGYAVISEKVEIEEENSKVINEVLINENINDGGIRSTDNIIKADQNIQNARQVLPNENEISIPKPTWNSYIETVGGTNFEMIFVKGGTFEMGSTDGEKDEKPVRLVTIKDFKMGKTEVTQALWAEVLGTDPSKFKGNNLPVEQVSWINVLQFIQKLNLMTGKKYRLPTEAEWEYAASASPATNSSTGSLANNNKTKWAGTNIESELSDFAWYTVNSERKTHPVGTKRPNSLGLCDMSGNVWEWCNDCYGLYNQEEVINPKGVPGARFRVMRGGGYDFYALYTKTTRRDNDYASYFSDYLGFRLACD